MSVARSLAPFLASATLTWALADAPPVPPPPVPPPPAAPDVVAVVDGTPIARDALMQRAAPALARQRQAEYELVRQVIDDLVDERLLQNVAARANTTPEAWLAAEVGRRTHAPSPTDVERFYQQHRSAFEKQSLDQARPDITSQLLGESHRAAELAIRRDLRAAAKIAVRLDPPRADVSSADAPALGPAAAAVTIVEFGDYEDTFTRQAEATLAKVRERYGDRVRLVFRDFPAPFHTLAGKAAEAARCAGVQGKFWPMHDALLAAADRRLMRDDLAAHAKGAGVDLTAFTTCLDGGETAAAIAADAAAGRAAGVTAPPVFFVNGVRVSGSAPIEEFAAVIDRELARKGM